MKNLSNVITVIIVVLLLIGALGAVSGILGDISSEIPGLEDILPDGSTDNSDDSITGEKVTGVTLDQEVIAVWPE